MPTRNGQDWAAVTAAADDDDDSVCGWDENDAKTNPLKYRTFPCLFYSMFDY